MTLNLTAINCHFKIKKMKWTQKEKDIMLGFCISSDEETKQEMFEYVKDMMLENGFNRTKSQIKNMYYKIIQQKPLSLKIIKVSEN